MPIREAAGETFDLWELARVLRRHVLLVSAVTAAVTAASAYLAYTMPLVYESQATVRMTDARRALAGTLGSEVTERIPGGRDPVLSEIQVLRSRTLLGRTVDRAGLRLRPLTRGVSALLVNVQVGREAGRDTLDLSFDETGVTAGNGRQRARADYGAPLALGAVRFTVAERPSFDEARLAVDSRDQAISRLGAGLRTRPRERTDIVDLTYTADDPLTAQRVLDGLVAEFQMMDVQKAQQESQRRRQFIETQLEETDGQLQQAQLALSSFRASQQGLNSREKFTAEQSGAVNLEVRREELEADRQLATALLARLDRSGGDSGSLRALVASPAIASNPVVSQLYAQLVMYEERIDSLTTGAYRSSDDNPDVRRVRALAASTRGRIAEAVRSQMASLDARIAALDNLLARRQQRLQALPGVEAEETRLAQQVAATQVVADQLRTELQKARIAEAVEAGQVEVVDTASHPAGPIPTRRSLRLALGFMLGLMSGAGIALLREHTNTSIRSREELEEALQTPALAVIPQVGDRDRRRLRRAPRPTPTGEGLVTANGARSMAAEGYRTLRTNLIFSQTHQKLGLLLVSSAGPAEGKTTTSCNLAVTFAQQGMRVVLVDCDLRRPRVHVVFGTSREPGLTQLMLGHNSAEEAVRATEIENLFVLPSGTLPPNPSELLGSERMVSVLRTLKASFDLVIVDTPPVLLAPDASILGAGADGVLLVVRAGLTDRAAVRQSRLQLETVGARVIGAVLNDPDAKMTVRYGGYYATGYYGSEE